MLRRTTIRTRVLVGLALPALALVLVVALNLRRSLSLGLVVAAVLVVAVAVAVTIARSIARPITLLAAQVADVSLLQRVDTARGDELLPPRHDAHAYGGEIGQLANAIATGRLRALQTVAEQRAHHSTLEEMAANSAQRTNSVLAAALSQIDELARRDHDTPTATSLASVQRMVARADRHTAGVLALLGRDLPPVEHDTSIAEVLWAACLAVEAADRIDFVSMTDGFVRAGAVNDLAHLLAEMLENAAHATGDASRVTVLGEENDIGYLVTVVDHGGGMDAAALAEANRRVGRATATSAESVPPRALGLDIVGRLARRQGIVVRLGESSDGGIVVRVEIPASVLADAPPVEAPVVALDLIAAEAVEAPEPPVPAEPVLADIDEAGTNVASAAGAAADEPETRAADAVPASSEVVEPVEPVEVAEEAVEEAEEAEAVEPVAAADALEVIDLTPRVEVHAPEPRPNGLAGLPGIVIDPLPYVVKVHRPHDELLPSGPRKKRWAAALAKAGQ